MKQGIVVTKIKEIILSKKKLYLCEIIEEMDKLYAGGYLEDNSFTRTDIVREMNKLEKRNKIKKIGKGTREQGMLYEIMQ